MLVKDVVYGLRGSPFTHLRQLGSPAMLDGNSYKLEEVISVYHRLMTNETEKAAYDYFAAIDMYGGVIPALEAGFFHREIAESAYRYQKEVDARKRTVVGVNDYVVGEPLSIPILAMDKEGEKKQFQRLSRTAAGKGQRDGFKPAWCPAEGGKGQREHHALYSVEAVSAYATLGEICSALRKVFGEYRLPTFI